MLDSKLLKLNCKHELIQLICSLLMLLDVHLEMVWLFPSIKDTTFTISLRQYFIIIELVNSWSFSYSKINLVYTIHILLEKWGDLGGSTGGTDNVNIHESPSRPDFSTSRAENQQKENQDPET